MEPLILLNPSVSKVNLAKCIVCQLDRKEKLSKATESGCTALITAATERKGFNDIKGADKIERILAHEKSEEYVYHRTCYQDFSNQTNIQRLRPKPFESKNPKRLKVGNEWASRVLRSNPGAKTNKNLCIICQVCMFIFVCNSLKPTLLYRGL